jgi:hypothetical protein
MWQFPGLGSQGEASFADATAEGKDVRVEKLGAQVLVLFILAF